VGIDDYDEKALFSDTIPAGSVVKTIPTAGRRSLRDTVTLYVSHGAREKLVTVPDLMGD
jgi:serine/threonine-protein kinase